jgi:hypothetical protein
MIRGLLVSLMALLALVAISAVQAPRALADERDFTLVNGSRTVITHVYVSPTQSNDWGDDILGRDILNPGESVFIYFNRFEGNSCFHDIRVLAYGGAGEGMLRGINLCTTDTVTFS